MSALLDRGLDRLRLRRAPGRPSQVHLSVTDRCFLPCLHCDIWKNEGPDLPGHVWEDVIDRLGEWCAPGGMNFVGGEPLLRRDLEALMARAVSRGFKVSFNTNGWLMTEKRAAAIAAAGVSIAYVSLDGADPATVDRSRGKAGSYDKAMAAIDLLSGRPGLQVVVACVLTGDNASQMGPLLQLVRAKNLQLVVQPLYQNFGDVAWDPHWWRTSTLWPHAADDRAAIDAALDLLSIERDRGGPVCNRSEQLQAIKLHFDRPEDDLGLSCRAGHSDLSFDPHGGIRLCYFLDPVGSVFDPAPLQVQWDGWTALRRRWEVSRCGRHCSLLNCNFDATG